MKRMLLIRVDGDALIGTGHLMRCLALAQAWRRSGGHAVFASASLTPALAARVTAEGFETIPLGDATDKLGDASRTIALAQSKDSAWVVADGYGFDDEWQRRLSEAGLRLLVCDDHRHARHVHADVVCNPNPAFSRADYPELGGSATRLMLGGRYALLREEFAAWRAWRREHAPVARKVLVTLGGGDSENVTLTAIEALRLLPDVEAQVVIGASNPHRQALESAVAGAANLHLVVNAANMPELMAWADVAFSAGGSTCWELAFMGLPSVVTVLADNQARIAAELNRQGVCISLGDHRESSREKIAEALRGLMLNAERRATMSRRGRELIDGHGAARATAALGAPLKITLVSDADSWVNAFLPDLKDDFEAAGHRVSWMHDPNGIEPGDLTFLLSLGRIVRPAVLRRNAHNLVVHASAPPHGRGWSPLTWQVLEGRNEIPVSLLEAGESVDSGVIYAQDVMRLRGDELVDELRTAVAASTIRLCREFVAQYPFICDTAREQQGEPSYYRKRGTADSQLDPDKTLREQFNLLRVSDPDRYPAFFEILGRRYHVRITAAS